MHELIILDIVVCNGFVMSMIDVLIMTELAY